MKTQHEYNVALNVGKLLKEAGFDWETEFGQHIWDSSKRLETNKNFNSEKYLVSLPTLEVAQRWLREVKKISIEVNTCRFVNRHQDGKYTVSYRYELWPIDTSIVPNNDDKFIRYTIDYACNIEFQTYEEALEAGITKALEIILDKNMNYENTLRV